ncbi:hypothetical protein MAR_028677 [Mya arenaria]|uniref:Uncharacterized protein n=1 Tax=Mya arenaria TaxID=6604 RepID=A0ABY7DH02_MYAAR|nr:hypothetical protein MAR_028677 [Mya arenaria]
MALLICPPVSKRSHLSIERSHNHWSSSVGSSKEQQFKRCPVSEHFKPSFHLPVTRKEKEKNRKHNANANTKAILEGIQKHKSDIKTPEPLRIAGSPGSLSDPGCLTSESVVQSTPRPSLPTFLENETLDSTDCIQIHSSSADSSPSSFEDSDEYLAPTLFLDVEENFRTEYLNFNNKEGESVKHCNYVNLIKETGIRWKNSSLNNDGESGAGTPLPLSPMIKEELKLKIQLRRLTEGKSELPFIHAGPKKTTYQTKSNAEKDECNAVNKQIEEHTKLQQEVATLLKRRDRLKHLLDNHMETCTRVKL